MAHHNNTPANVLTAPTASTKLLAGVEVQTDKKGKQVSSQTVATGGYEVQLTGQVTNPKKAAERNRKAAARRVRQDAHAKRCHKG
jgi:hypothetical protein